MSSEKKEKFRREYQTGKAAFERGNYREAVKHLEAASALINRTSRLGGEAQMWLVTAYEATGQKSEAIALCKQLSRHPDPETSKQGKRLLYILQAPQLKRPAEWMTSIPDLGTLGESDPKDRRGSSRAIVSDRKSRDSLEAIDPSQINTKDNQFIWVALIASIVVIGGLIWFGV